MGTNCKAKDSILKDQCWHVKRISGIQPISDRLALASFSISNIYTIQINFAQFSKQISFQYQNKHGIRCKKMHRTKNNYNA